MYLVINDIFADLCGRMKEVQYKVGQFRLVNIKSFVIECNLTLKG